VSLGGVVAHQVERVDAEPLGEPLDRPQREIPLTALDAPHVGPVHVEHVSECLLAEPELESAPAQLPAQPSLELSFHAATMGRCYFWVYRPISSAGLRPAACRRCLQALAAAKVGAYGNRELH